jgi:hypothetical protein
MAATLFGTTGQGDLHGPDLSTLYEVNPTTGALTLIGPVGYVVTGMDYYNGTLYGVTSYRDTSYHGLITIDTTTGTGTPVGSGWGASLLDHTIAEMAVDSAGNAYGWQEADSEDLTSINLVTGLLSPPVGDAGLSTSQFGLAFDLNNVLHFINRGGNVYTINTVTGATTLVGNLGVPNAHHGDVDPDTGIYYGLSEPGMGFSDLLAVDLANLNVLSTVRTDQELHTLAFVPVPAVNFDPNDPTKATGITDLNVNGTLYDVAFNLQAFAFEIYGPFPGVFPIFDTAQEASDARDAVLVALNAEGALSLGEVGLAVVESNAFNIGYGSLLDPILEVQLVQNARGFAEGADWITGGLNTPLYNGDERTYAEFTVAGGPPPSGVDLTGTVEDAGGTPLCALALASGQFMFTCNPNGPYSLLDLPAESDGSVKRQVYVDGFFPNVEVLQGSVDETVVMTRAGTCPDYNSFPQPGVFPGSAGKRINISGTILLQNTQTPVCAMVLANGQFGFTCDGTGNYAANIPLDNNGQYKLQAYAQGFAPMVQRFDEFQAINDVRMARAVECQ